MKKVLLLATAALLFTGAAFAEGGKGKNKKKCAKGKTCCTKTAKASCSKDKSSCSHDKSKTAEM